MLRKALALSIAWYALAIVLTGCDCTPSPAQKIKLTSLNLSVYRYSIDSTGSVQIGDSLNDFALLNPAIQTRMSYEMIAANRHAFPGMANRAYAFQKCETPPSYIPEHHIKSLKVLTINAYDTGHPAMSDVSTYFRVLRYSSDSGYVLLKPLIIPAASGEMSYEDLYYFIYLETRPAIGTKHQFRIEYTLDDESILSGTTSELNF